MRKSPVGTWMVKFDEGNIRCSDFSYVRATSSAQAKKKFLSSSNPGHSLRMGDLKAYRVPDSSIIKDFTDKSYRQGRLSVPPLRAYRALTIGKPVSIIVD